MGAVEEMKFPLPQIKEEDRCLLRDVRAKRKYELRNKKSKKYPLKKNKNDEKNSNSYCMITVTGIGGAIIIIITIIFTVMEIMNNRNTSITAYPINYNDNNNNNDNDNNNGNIMEKNPNYVYPRISLDEVRAEIQRARAKETEMAQEMINLALETQLSYIPLDLPSDFDINSDSIDLIDKYFKETEFYQRWRNSGDIEWTKKLSSSIAIYNESLYNNLPICVHISNRQNGFGYRNWRDGQIHFMTQLMSCTLAIHWGWIDFCPSQTKGSKDVYNIFEILFYNNYNFAASHKRYNTFSNTEKYPVLTSFNQYLAGRAYVIYDLEDKSFINNSKLIIENANKNILPSKSQGINWPKTANKYDKNLNIVQQDIQMVDKDIDAAFGELIGWNGAINIIPVLDYYGLMVQHLRYKYRKIIVDFIEENWKNKFVISYHLQIGNGDNSNFQVLDEQIIDSLKYLLTNNNEIIIDNKDIVIYISTDCGQGSVLQNFMNEIKTKIDDLIKNIDGYNIENINILLREQERVEFGKGHPFESKHQIDDMEKCVDIISNIQIDAELLGLGDILVLPSRKQYSSTFTRLSRALMMKRHKTICRCVNKQFHCKNFDTKTTVSFSLT